MSTHITTRNPVRSDVRQHDGGTSDGELDVTPPRTSRSWALAGIGSGVAGIGAIVASSLANAVYDPALEGDAAAIVDKLSTQTGPLIAFHSLALVSAVLLVVFGAGLFRRLRDRHADSIAPLVAFAGLAGTAVVQVIGTSLDTEFMFGLSQDRLVDSTGVMYGHWVGTVPWCWVLAGLAGVALHVAGRTGSVPRWIGRVGLVLGGLTLLVGISPLQYLAGMVGPLWLLVTAIGFAAGDRAYRTGR